VLAWADIQADPERRRRYQQARGKGGLVRVTWAEATELIAAAHVHTIKTYGPDRVAGFSPIPAMSMVSYAAGSRFFELIGGAMTSFYDWYADLPVASPQVFGDQTDVPESGDWWDAAYLMMWGSNALITRTPDAHWMAEASQRRPGDAARTDGRGVACARADGRRDGLRRDLRHAPARHDVPDVLDRWGHP
jgi:nitrate reductase / nitrite oxidoreductase, alpha subunit